MESKQLNWKHLENLNPDIVIGNKEENTPAIFKGLRDRNILLLHSLLTVETAIADISSLEDYSVPLKKQMPSAETFILSLMRLSPITTHLPMHT